MSHSTDRRQGLSFTPVSSYLLTKSVAPAFLVYVGMDVFHSIPLAVVLYHGFCLANFLFAHRKELKSGAPPLFEILRATVSGIILSLAAIGLWRLTGCLIPDPDLCRMRLGTLGLPVGLWGVFSAYFILVNPVIEELYWRGCVQEDAQCKGITGNFVIALPF